MTRLEDLNEQLTVALNALSRRERRLKLAREGLAIVRQGVEALQAEHDDTEKLVASIRRRRDQAARDAGDMSEVAA